VDVLCPHITFHDPCRAFLLGGIGIDGWTDGQTDGQQALRVLPNNYSSPGSQRKRFSDCVLFNMYHI
jgi:hypothetical protein